jgi:dihydroflavonol-4-reductase
MRVLVTGSSGFLGRAVTHALLRAKHQLRLLVRNRNSFVPVGDHIEIADGDLLDRASLARAMRGQDAVIHAAGFISLKPRDRDRLEQVNVEGTRNVVTEAARMRIPVVHTSSVATVGYTDEPQVRDGACLMPADQATEFGYAGSKLRAEQQALLSAARGHHIVVMNPGLLLGPGDLQDGSTRPVAQYLRREMPFCLGGGISIADVRDVADAYVAALSKGSSGRRYLLGSHNLTYAQLFQSLSTITGLPTVAPVPRYMAAPWGVWSEWSAMLSPHRFEELNSISVKYASMFNYCDSSSAITDLGYRARPLEVTLRDTVVDLLKRGAATPSTTRMRQLLSTATEEN